MEHLKKLDLRLTAIKELPTSVENLPSLKIINFYRCIKLATLPSSVYKLQNLEHLNLGGCSNFVTFPKNLEDSNNPNDNLGFRKLNKLNLYGCNLSEVEFLESSSSFPKLGHLDLSGNKFTHLPTCINKYKYLEHLYMDNCEQIQKIPQLPPNVHALSTNGCTSLQESPDLSSLSSDCCRVDLSSCRKFFRQGALSLEVLPTMGRFDIRLVGKEMPELFFHGTDSSIPFVVPPDLDDKFLGLALCFVLGPNGKINHGSADVLIYVNGHMVFACGSRVYPMVSDDVWIGYFPRNELVRGRKRRDGCSHFQVNFIPQNDGVELKKCGFRPICERREDEMRIVRQSYQPMETKFLLEGSDSDEDNWMDNEEEESSWETDDELIEAIDQEKEPGLFKADKIGPLEERDSEEDSWIDTEKEERSSETDDELIKAIDQDEEERQLQEADKLECFGSVTCCGAKDVCRSLKTLVWDRFLRKTFWEY